MTQHVDIVGLVAVAGAFGVILVAVIGGLVIGAIKALKGGSSKKSRAAEAEEAKLMQQIHAGLARMEQRIETLETLLFDSGKNASERARK
jgi:phage shock protein B